MSVLVSPCGDSLESEGEVNLVLVNTISPYYLVRYQAPLAVNILNEYVSSKVEAVRVSLVDMQAFYEKASLRGGEGVEENFEEALRLSIAEVCGISETAPTILGLSIKWAAVEVAERIVRGVQESSNGEVLTVLGNLGATFGYKELLKEDAFKKALAVVGEGEEALTQIVRRAIMQNGNFSEASNYADIPNVATANEGRPAVESIQRVDLSKYPRVLKSADSTYDKVRGVHCLETSRGCPWGNCTFCSVDGQLGGGEDNGWQPFPMEIVLGNIRSLVEQGARRFDIKDSEFFGAKKGKDKEASFRYSMERVKSFTDGIKEINATLDEGDEIVFYHLSARVDTVYRTGEEKENAEREEAYRSLKEAGVKGIYLGIESGSPSQLKRFGKGVSVEENKKALEILRRLGFDVEVGLIFFDYLATVQELEENVAFIEETGLYKTESRILGSLRVQEGSPYVKMAGKQGILGRKHRDHLGYKCNFLNEDVEDLEWRFIQWEKATVKLVKILPLRLALEVREMDFMLMKELVNDSLYSEWGEAGSIIAKFREKRADLLRRIRSDEEVIVFNRENLQLFEEHLQRAERQNTENQY
jgi:radical SAM family protein